MAERSEAKLRVKIFNLRYIDAKLRFAILNSQRSAIFETIVLQSRGITVAGRKNVQQAGRQIQASENLLCYIANENALNTLHAIAI